MVRSEKAEEQKAATLCAALALLCRRCHEISPFPFLSVLLSLTKARREALDLEL
jgi:hypothetical protein